MELSYDIGMVFICLYYGLEVKEGLGISLQSSGNTISLDKVGCAFLWAMECEPHCNNKE